MCTFMLISHFTKIYDLLQSSYTHCYVLSVRYNTPTPNTYKYDLLQSTCTCFQHSKIRVCTKIDIFQNFPRLTLQKKSLLQTTVIIICCTNTVRPQVVMILVWPGCMSGFLYRVWFSKVPNLQLLTGLMFSTFLHTCNVIIVGTQWMSLHGWKDEVNY